MTTLRTFQTEIDEIHNREVAKQRAKVAAPPDRDKEKEPNDHKVTPIATAKGKSKDDGTNTAPAKPVGSATVIRSSLLDLEDSILVCIIYDVYLVEQC